MDSCINQTLRDIEIICINDCSPDNSHLILEKYSSRDSRIKIINHEKNMGLGAARNTGIKAAEGEYIWFIDSDDWIAKNACQILYDTAKNQNVDILSFNAINVIDIDGIMKLEMSDYFTEWPHNTLLVPRQCQALTGKHFPVSAWHYITKRNVMMNYKFRTGCYYEDTDFTPIIFYESNSFMNICYTGYFRRINPESITQTNLTPKKIQDKIDVVKSLDMYIKKNKINYNTFLYNFYNGYKNFVCHEIRNSEFAELFSKNKDYLEFESKRYREKKNNKLFLYIKKIVKALLPYGIVRLYGEVKK